MNPIESNTVKPIIGTEEATIDDKGRVLVSKKKRERLGSPFVLTAAMLGQLVAYPQSTFDRRYKEMFEGEAINHDREDYTRLMLALADDDIHFDQQGRFVVPSRLRNFAKLPEKVLLVGVGDGMEIWDPSEYSEWTQRQEAYNAERRHAVQRAFIQMSGRIS